MTSELAAGITDPTARDAMAVHRRHAIAPEAVAVAHAVGTSPEIDVDEILGRPVRQRGARAGPAPEEAPGRAATGRGRAARRPMCHITEA